MSIEAWHDGRESLSVEESFDPSAAARTSAISLRFALLLSHRTAWLAAPLALTVFCYGSYRVDPVFFDAYMRPETGFIENATSLWFLLAFLLGVAIRRRRAALPARWVRTYFLLITLGCLFVSGEELSWGQHWFGWETPEPIAAINEQEEMNIHNAHELLLNRGPRTLLGIFAIAMGVGWVARNLLMGVSHGDRNDWRYWLYPGVTVLPVALLVMVSRWPYYIERLLGLEYLLIFDFGKYTEMLEFQLGAFMLLYTATVLRRAAGAEPQCPTDSAKSPTDSAKRFRSMKSMPTILLKRRISSFGAIRIPRTYARSRSRKVSAAFSKSGLAPTPRIAAELESDRSSGIAGPYCSKLSEESLTRRG